MIRYGTEKGITVDKFVDLLNRSTLAERRPVENTPVLEQMLAHADILVTAWDGDLLIGVARSVTDYGYCCYLSDLAVDETYQRSGIGRELVHQLEAVLEPSCSLILLSAPSAIS